MKIILVALLCIGALEVFSFGILAHQDNGALAANATDCVAGTIAGTPCSKQANTTPLTELDFQLNAIRKMSMASFQEMLTATLWIILGSIALFLISRLRAVFIFAARLFRFQKRFFSRASLPLSDQLASWLALHETSPAG